MKILVLLFMFCFSVFAQKENALIRNGNKKFAKENYNSAIKDYGKSLELNPDNNYAKFNLGNTFYKLDSAEAAQNFYQGMISGESSDLEKSLAYYNYGNSLMKSQKFDKSIEAYKNSLKLNPSDTDAKYNLEYAKKMLQQQQDQDQNQDKNQDQDDNKDQNQDKKNEQNQDQNNKDDKQKQDQGDKQDNQQKNEDQQNQDGSKQSNEKNNQNQKGEGKQAQEMKISKEQAEQILKNLAKQEKALLMKTKKKKGEKKKVEKNW
ncbi:tetratricopeptide repeat protein [Candidatus Kapabacteria bacterium]|nr:tetratricopeptide repeat protein [Candidatus Kapabacteria bacterium]